MHIGVVFPQNEIEPEPGALRAYAQGVQELGFHHIAAFDHVVGADPAEHEGWADRAAALGTSRVFDVSSRFHEPFVLFGFLAGVSDLELVSGVLILPQRQTVLVAKQAAEVDVLTGGRFRLGIGLGWNPLEYEALGQDFSNRGARVEEQIAVLRMLWTQTSVRHEGAFERVPGAGLAPLPVQRPIPIWIGPSAVPALRRVGRLADGWFPRLRPGPELDDARAIVDAAAISAGRDPATIGMEGRVVWGDGGAEQLVRHCARWRETGATHVGIVTLGLGGVDAHLAVLEQAADALGLTARSSAERSSAPTP